MSIKTNTYKYAIYGGTFDPIHLAHVKLADCAVKELNLDELIFMPAYINPFKQNQDTSTAEDRLAMIETILPFNPRFNVSDYEIAKHDVSYTIDTLEYFKANKDGQIYFVLGYDTFINLDKWYQGEKILKEYPIITGNRPGISDQECDDKLKYYIKSFGANIHIVDMQPMNISSTSIREAIKNNCSLQDQVLSQTEEYILEHKLYK